MHLSSGDIYQPYRPWPCALRLHLSRNGVERPQPGPYQEVIRKLGEQHEQAHLAGFETVRDLSGGSPEERRRGTIEALQDGVPVIYQPCFRAETRR